MLRKFEDWYSVYMDYRASMAGMLFPLDFFVERDVGMKVPEIIDKIFYYKCINNHKTTLKTAPDTRSILNEIEARLGIYNKSQMPNSYNSTAALGNFSKNSNEEAKFKDMDMDFLQEDLIPL